MLFSKDLVNILGEVILVISECLHRFYLKVARIPYKTIVTLNIAFYNYKKKMQHRLVSLKHQYTINRYRSQAQNVTDYKGNSRLLNAMGLSNENVSIYQIH